MLTEPRRCWPAIPPPLRGPSISVRERRELNPSAISDTPLPAIPCPFEIVSLPISNAPQAARWKRFVKSASLSHAYSLLCTRTAAPSILACLPRGQTHRARLTAYAQYITSKPLARLGRFEIPLCVFVYVSSRDSPDRCKTIVAIVEDG